MAFYYRLESDILPPGTLVQPGNYGRIVLEMGEKHGAFRREMAYEQVRIILFPHRPSRLSSLFCFVTISEALLFRKHINGFYNHHLYEVSSDEIDPFIADPNNALQHQDLPTFDFDIIKWYWQGWSAPPNLDAVILREALLRKPVTIVRKVPVE